MRALLTGAAGFIGSQMAVALLAEGYEVLGVDSFSPYYDPSIKRGNLRDVDSEPRFSLVEADLISSRLEPLLDGVDVVFHLAAQPGVRLSWSDGFRRYAEDNIVATQRLLEAAKESSVGRFIYASSSSVYGDHGSFPKHEIDLPRPHSPYGVTKLAGEHLCALYADNWGVPTVALRYFTVYGPRQRPDMAIHRMIQAAIQGTEFPLYGSGDQVRDFTFVGDVVRANLAAAASKVPGGSVFNVCGGSEIQVNDLLKLLESILQRSVPIAKSADQPGDVRRTGGSSELAARELGWHPTTSLEDGLKAQVAWHLQHHHRASLG